MWGQIKKQFLEIVMSSVVIVLALWLFRGYSFWMTFLIFMMFNLSLAGGMWLSEHYNRPIMWQLLMIVFLGIVSSIILNWGIKDWLDETGLIDTYKQINFLLIISCILVNVVGYKELRNNIKRRIDMWFPPMWSIVVAMFICLILDGKRDSFVRSISIAAFAGALIIASGSKNDRFQDDTICYDIATKHYFKGLALFASAVVLLSFSIPLMTELPFTKEVRQTAEKWTGWESSNMEQLRLSRYPSSSKEIVLTAKGEGPIYLRRLAYTTYENGYWKVGGQVGRGWTSLGKGISEQIYPEFSQMLKLIASKQIVIPDLAEEYQSIFEKKGSVVRSQHTQIKEKSKPDSYLSINGVYNLKQNKGGSSIGYNGELEDLYFMNADKHQQSAYNIYYKVYYMGDRNREGAVLKQMNYERFSRLVSQAIFNSPEEVEALHTLEKQIEGYKRIQKQYTQVPNNIVGQLKEYGSLITVGCESDLDKAEAILNKLKNSGEYIYKMGARYSDSSNDPVEDFLLYGKAGVCQDFASGMVLLCRSVGLPARYVDGYYGEEIKEGTVDEYVIRKKDAHAFAEVYISGYGWMSFDPTTSNETFVGSHLDEIGRSRAFFNWKGLKQIQLIAIIGAIILLVCMGSKPIRIRIWGLYLSQKSPAKALHLLLEGCLKVLDERGIQRAKDETLSQLTERMLDEGINISPITKCFEAYYYGKQRPRVKQLREAYSCYIELNKEKTWKKQKEVTGKNRIWKKHQEKIERHI